MPARVQSDIVCTAYHYTSDSYWCFTQAGYFSDGKHLHPYRNLTAGIKEPGFPNWSYDNHIFAFLNESVPESWKNNTEFPDIWERIIRHVMHGDSILRLLKFEVTVEDEAHVIDWSHIERLRPELRRMRNFMASEEDISKIKLAIPKYLQSRVPVTEYKGEHGLPELIIKNPISLERVKEIEEFTI